MMKKGKRSVTTHFVPPFRPTISSPRSPLTRPQLLSGSRLARSNPKPNPSNFAFNRPSISLLYPRNPLGNSLKTASPSQKCQYTRYTRLGIAHLASYNSPKQRKEHQSH